jgi:phosphoserine/homoserine phosphotransferase
MYITCLDLESILFPEIWINVAEKKNIPELRLTTRDVSDYDALMKNRIKILKSKKIKLADIQEVIEGIEPFDGTLDFLDWLNKRCQIIILTDSFYEFVGPLVKKINYPTVFCNWLEVDENNFIKSYVMRQDEGKRESVKALKSLGFKVVVVGDSYNDTEMLEVSDVGILFNASDNMRKDFPQFKNVKNFHELKSVIENYI